ncbi:conserved repeat protein [Leptolyngbyaceae cyanobacterium JSC-12]|nr:conserved repeat protein [Leptolyngbyaceae cyanobacterium JSC-12]
MNRPLKILTCLVSAGALFNSPPFLFPTRAQIAGGNTGCPIGTRESRTNRIRNGNFTINAGTGLGVQTPPAPVPTVVDFFSDLPYRGDAVYPSDVADGANLFGGGGISIQDERFNSGQIPNALPGIVSGRGVTVEEATRVGLDPDAIPTYLYSNPSLNTAGQPTTIPPAPPGTPPPVLWSQTVNVSPNTVYNFEALFFNLLLPGAPGLDPQIRLQANGVQTADAIVVGDGSPLPGFPNIPNVRQAWVPVQFQFTTSPGQTSLQLRIVDETQNIVGDDFGVTAISLRECLPNLGVAKQAGTPVRNADGTFTIPYTVSATNLAPVVGIPDPYLLSNVQLTENLATTFANATIVSVSQPQSQTFTVNPGFNGTTDTQLLQSGVNTLGAGATGSVSFSVTILPPSLPQTYTNTAVGTGTTSTGDSVQDQSNNGANPDPDGDGNPSNNNDLTTVTVPPEPFPPTGQGAFLLVKRITNITRGGVSLAGNNFAAFVDDPTTINDNAPGWVQLNPPGAPIGLINASNTAPLQTGDEVEYTVYFLSSGLAPVIDVNICDLIPPGTTLIPATNVIRLGNREAVSGGTVFTPLAPLPDNNSCLDQRNPNGAIIFNLGNVSNLPSDNVGFVRFRVRVN